MGDIVDLLPEGTYDCVLARIWCQEEQGTDPATGAGFVIPFIVFEWKMESGPRRGECFHDRINTLTSRAEALLGSKVRALGFDFDRNECGNIMDWVDENGLDMLGVKARLRLRHSYNDQKDRSRVYWWYEGRVVPTGAGLEPMPPHVVRQLMEAGLGR